jgi:hypothetical protein
LIEGLVFETEILWKIENKECLQLRESWDSAAVSGWEMAIKGDHGEG